MVLGVWGYGAGYALFGPLGEAGDLGVITLQGLLGLPTLVVVVAAAALALVLFWLSARLERPARQEKLPVQQ